MSADVNASRFWLGPFAVRKVYGRWKSGSVTWSIITRSGFAYKIHIPYKVDAQVECDRLNAAGGVVPQEVPRRSRYQWTAEQARAAGRRGALNGWKKKRQQLEGQ